MKRRWNWRIWVGFLLVIAGMVSFPLLFINFPLTRDFPWANLVLFAAGLGLLGVGVARAYRRRDEYRGRIFGPVLGLLSLATVAFFVWGVFIVARQLPASAAAPHVGQKAPDFVLTDQDGKPLALADLLSPPSKAAVLIFYRGYW
jgi:hypothetical protein